MFGALVLFKRYQFIKQSSLANVVHGKLIKINDFNYLLGVSRRYPFTRTSFRNCLELSIFICLVLIGGSVEFQEITQSIRLGNFQRYHLMLTVFGSIQLEVFGGKRLLCHQNVTFLDTLQCRKLQNYHFQIMKGGFLTLINIYYFISFVF